MYYNSLDPISQSHVLDEREDWADDFDIDVERDSELYIEEVKPELMDLLLFISPEKVNPDGIDKKTINKTLLNKSVIDFANKNNITTDEVNTESVEFKNFQYNIDDLVNLDLGEKII